MTVANRRKARRIGLLVLVVAAALAITLWYHLLREVDVHHAAIEDHFQYGSVGVEEANGAPYWIWYVLPSVCGDRPSGREGYLPYGFLWEEGRPGPVGMPIKTIGFDRIGINCGLCHVGTYRESADGATQVAHGAPSSTIDLGGYLDFLFDCASSPKFERDAIMREIRKVTDLSLIEGLLYRFLIIPQTREALLRQKLQLGWRDQNPPWGPGRQDPFNPAKGQLLKHPFDGSIGNADIMPLWGFAKRTNHAYHWNGLNDSLTEIFLNSGIGNGATAKTINVPALERVQNWVTALEPPPYPFPIDEGLAAKGSRLYEQRCASCHAYGGEQTAGTVALHQVGTDWHRLASWSAGAAKAFNGLDDYEWTYRGFQPSFGYVSPPLDGVWLRAPYLHNGSVPTLVDMLKPPAERPAQFYRGYDVFDPEGVGFVAHGPEAEQQGWRYDTSVPGNSNQGHLWGTDLSTADRSALVEYLKTL